MTVLPARAVKVPWLMRYLRHETRIRAKIGALNRACPTAFEYRLYRGADYRHTSAVALIAPPGDSNRLFAAGDVLVRLRAISIMPRVGATQSLSALNVDVDNAIVPELDLTCMIRDYLGVELIPGTSQHQLASNFDNPGGVNVLPPTLLLQDHFNHAGCIGPYVGPGINYTFLYNNGLNVGGQAISITITASVRHCRQAWTCRSPGRGSSTWTSGKSGCIPTHRLAASHSAG